MCDSSREPASSRSARRNTLVVRFLVSPPTTEESISWTSFYHKLPPTYAKNVLDYIKSTVCTPIQADHREELE
jgi:hypothetical protein